MPTPKVCLSGICAPHRQNPSLEMPLQKGVLLPRLRRKSGPGSFQSNWQGNRIGLFCHKGGRGLLHPSQTAPWHPPFQSALSNSLRALIQQVPAGLLKHPPLAFFLLAESAQHVLCHSNGLQHVESWNSGREDLKTCAPGLFALLDQKSDAAGIMQLPAPASGLAQNPENALPYLAYTEKKSVLDVFIFGPTSLAKNTA